MKFFVTLFLSLQALAFAQTPQQINERMRQAQSFERMGFFEQALNLYRPLFEQDPRNAAYYQGVKRSLLQLRRYDELLALIDRRLTVVGDLNARVDRGDVLFKKGDEPGALKYWQELLQQAPLRDTYAMVAAAMRDNNSYDEALKVYLAGREKLRDPSLFTLDLANLYELRLEFENATTEYVRLLQSDQRQFPLVQRRLLEMTNEYEVNENIVATIEKLLPNHPAAESLHRLRASLFLQNKEYGRAFSEYQTLERIANPADKANAGNEIFNFAEEARRAEACDYAAQAYRLILNLEKSPYAYPALMGMGQCLRVQGKHTEALEAFAQLLQKTGSNNRNPWTLRAWREQGEIYFSDLADMPNAIEIFRRIYEAYSDNAIKEKSDVVFRLGDCYLAKGDLKNAAQWYETARRFAAKSTLIQDKINFSLARLEYFHGRFRSTLQLLETITNRPRAREEEENQEEAESMVNDALELTLLLEANFADSAGALLSYAHAEFLTTQQKRDAAIDSLQQLVQRFPQATLVPQAQFSLAALLVKAGKYSEAAAAYQAILEKYSDSVVGDRALFHLAELMGERLQNYQQAQKLFEQLLRDYPNSIFLDEARRHARRLAEKNRTL
ncbi:tetratricopeptide repeat protein [candidate division KSB1 bacterium]|nr:tetratricopeptide repeat protein [candidate division KSB1 bacterium]